MAEQEKEDERVQTSRKETARADAAWMKQVYNLHIYFH